MYSFLKSLDKLHYKTYNYTHVPIYFRFVFVYQDSTDSDPPRLLCALIGMQGANYVPDGQKPQCRLMC